MSGVLDRAAVMEILADYDAGRRLVIERAAVESYRESIANAVMARLELPEPAELPAEPTIADALYELTELWTVGELVTQAMQDGVYCCQVGCGGGGCESCACCVAGYCVSGIDGIPTPGSDCNPADDPEHAVEVWKFWLQEAAKHNPAVALLVTAKADTLREAAAEHRRLAADSRTDVGMTEHEEAADWLDGWHAQYAGDGS